MFKIIHQKIKNAKAGCLLKFKSEQFSVQLFDSITKVNKDDWQRLVADDVFWGIPYHKTLESGCNSSVSFRYALIYKDKLPIGLFYFQLIDLKNKTVSDLLNPEYFPDLFAKMNGRSDDFVFGSKDKGECYLCICGNLFVSGNFGVKINDDELRLTFKQTFSAAMNLVEDSLADGSSIFATALKDYEIIDDLINAFGQMSFVDFEIDPDMVLKIDSNWKTYDDYLATFSSKYRVRANSAATKASALVIEEWDARKINIHLEQIENLFEAVLEKAPVRLANNTVTYFENLKKQLGVNFIFKAFLLNDKLVAFSTAIVCNEGIHAHHIGFDYEVNKKYALYQNLLYHFVQDAIVLKKQFVNFGRDAMEIKSTLGAAPVRLKLFVRFANSITQLILDSFLKLAKPKGWVQRKPFKIDHVEFKTFGVS